MMVAVLWTSAMLIGLASAVGLNTLWSLPLGLGPGSVSGLVPFATDGGVIYTANTRGVLFAVDATTAELLWSSPGNDDVSQILLFPEVPDKLYVVCYGLFQQVSVQAIRRGDGSVLGTLNNLTGAPPHMAVSGKRFALRHDNGIMVTDYTLNTIYWRQEPPPNTTSYFSQIGANAELVTTLCYPGGVFGRPASVQSFDAETGSVVCNLSFVSVVLVDDAWSQMILTRNNLSVGVFQASASSIGSWRALDLGRCEAIRTPNINDDAAGSITTPFVVRAAPDSDLFLAITPGSNNESFIISASPMSIDAVQAWSATIIDPLVFASLIRWPMVGRASDGRSAEAVLAVWWGSLTILNTSTGSKWTAVPNRVPAAPPCQSQFVFPLPADRLLVPNLQGYIILSSISGEVEAVELHDPVFITGAVATVVNSSSQQPFVVYVASSGELMAVN